MGVHKPQNLHCLILAWTKLKNDFSHIFQMSLVFVIFMVWGASINPVNMLSSGATMAQVGPSWPKLAQVGPKLAGLEFLMHKAKHCGFHMPLERCGPT